MKNRMVRLLLLTAFACTIVGCGGKKEAAPERSVVELPEVAEEDSVAAEDETEAAGESAEGASCIADAAYAEVVAAEVTDETAVGDETAADEEIEVKPTFGPSPDDDIQLPFASDVAYDPDVYPHIREKGHLSEEEIDHLMEAMTDMLAFDYIREGMTETCIYGEGSTQAFVPDERFGERITSASVYDGNPMADAIMDSVGYKDYYLTYYYTFGIWADEQEAYSEPLLVEMSIGENSYEYYFRNQELVCRSGPEGTSNNPKTNDFIDRIYRLGCYLGNVLNEERDRYNLFIMTSDTFELHDDYIVMHAQIQGREGFYDLILDENTVFSEFCEREFFEGLEDGESPLSWYMRTCKQIEKMEIQPTPVLGILDVRTKGNHVNDIMGTYWWD